MVKESLNILLSNYLLVCLLLFPAVLIYLVLTINQGSAKVVRGLHKGIVIVLLMAPLGLTSLAIYSNSNNSKQLDLQISLSTSTDTQTSITPISSWPLGYAESIGEIGDTSFLNYLQAIGIFLRDSLSVLFLGGCVLLILRLLRQVISLTLIRRSANTIGTVDGFKVIRSEKVQQAFSTQFLYRCVYLPIDIDKDKSSIILSHELNHFRGRHHWWLLMETLMTHLYWFNPLSHLLRHQGELIREFECDDATIKEHDKFRYGLALVEMAEAQCSSVRPSFLAHFWIGKKTLQKRIERILGKKESLPYKTAKIAMLLTVAAGITVFLYYQHISSRLLEDFAVAKMETTLSDQQNIAVDIDKVPKHFINLLLTVQDKRFYSHDGVDNIAFSAASSRFIGWKLFGIDTSANGGSTITMQTAKNFILPNYKPSISNKLQQVEVAKILEQHYSKEEILGVYLSGIFWGPNKTWGLRQAALKYYQKPYSELTLEESAMLIQMIPAPKYYNPIDHPDIAIKRQQQLVKTYKTAFSSV